MYITLQDGENKITKKVDGETWPEALEEFFYGCQGLGYMFKFSPNEMVDMLENAINESIDEGK
jgi:hypothetical protein